MKLKGWGSAPKSKKSSSSRSTRTRTKKKSKKKTSRKKKTLLDLLHKYQLDVVKFILKKNFGAVFLDPGLGKTLCFLYAFSILKKKGLVKKVNDNKRKGGARVILTLKGEETYEKVSERDSILRIISYLSKKERIQLKNILQQIRLEALHELGMKDYFTDPYPYNPEKAKKLLAEHGLNLDDLEELHKDRITEADVKNYLEQRGRADSCL